MPEDLKLESPEWWLRRLIGKLEKRRPAVQLYKDYYEGRHKLAFATRKFREAFGGLFSEFADNWCGVVVQAPAERLRPRGIAMGIGKDAKKKSHDEEAWRIWQENEMDASAGVHHTEILSTGYGHILVWADDAGRPTLTVEDSRQVICDYRPGMGRRPAAALKLWKDDWDDHEIAFLYLPDGIYKFRSEKPKKSDGSSARTKWRPYEIEDEEWPLENPLGVVPMVEFLNDPDVLRAGRSEIRRVIPMQNGINKLITDMFVTSEYSSFRQKYILGWSPDTDEEGLPNQAELKSAVDRMLTFDNENVKVGEFETTDLGNYVKAVELLVQHLAAQTRTPRHYLFQEGQSPSGDAIKSAETGLVAKVRDRQAQISEGYEEAIRIGFKILGDSARAGAYGAEVIWGDPEYRTEGEKTDAVLKRYQAGLITWEQALRDLDYTPQQIEEMRREKLSEAMLRQGVDLSRLLERPEPEPVQPAA